MKMQGTIGDLAGGVSRQMMVLGPVGDAGNRFAAMVSWLRPDELFSSSERAEFNGLVATVRRLYNPKGRASAKLLEAGNAARVWINEISRRVVPYYREKKNDPNPDEARRVLKIYRAWIPRDDDLKDFAIKAAIVVAAGYALGPASAGSGGAASSGFAPGGFASAGGTSFTAWSPSAYAAIVPTTGAGAFKAAAISMLKKLAIEKGVEFAVSYAAKEYAEKQQQKMAAGMEADLRAQLESAQKEYDSLIAAGATPEVASQTVAKPDKFGIAIIGLAALAAVLLSRR